MLNMLNSDDIRPKVFNFCDLSLLQSVYHLFLVSISTSNYVPIQWHSHYIVPIHKSGDKLFISELSSLAMYVVI